MKRIALLLLLCMTAILFCACTNPEGDSSDGGAQSSVDDGWTPPVK